MKPSTGSGTPQHSAVQNEARVRSTAVDDQRQVLLTGGAGFIGSHCCLDLLQSGYHVVVVDNLINSSRVAVDRVRELCPGALDFYQVDTTNQAELDRLFERHAIDVVIHFAAHKAVGDSVERPFEYYANNVAGTLNLLHSMRTADVIHLIFSSSCSVYGNATEMPLTEMSPKRPTNPYARSKLMCEQILEDVCTRYSDWSVTSLRYFNPVGAHESGRLGEDPAGPPSNILPLLARVAGGRIGCLQVFGGDYPTHDGTAVRDYIHVMDVVEGHRLALERGPVPGFHRYNLGTGVGTSVLELVQEFAAACGRDIPYEVTSRRPGDVAELVASPALANTDLGWQARRDLTQMCQDAWRFQERNPQGYEPS